jgi:hypothetical protein
LIFMALGARAVISLLMRSAMPARGINRVQQQSMGRIRDSVGTSTLDVIFDRNGAKETLPPWVDAYTQRPHQTHTGF